jgi:hypothetical protein
MRRIIPIQVVDLPLTGLAVAGKMVLDFSLHFLDFSVA